MGGPYAELIRRHQARLFAFLSAGTSSEQAASSLFGETFRLMAEMRVDLDADVDPDVMVYRYALRVRNRFEVPAPDPTSELSRMFEGIEPDDRIALALLVTSELAIADAANALRRPEPRLKDALAQALVTMTRAAVDLELDPATEGASSDGMVAMSAFGWLDAEDRAAVEADATAAPRRAAMERVLACLRERMPPRDPPEGLLPRVDAAVEKCMRESSEVVAKRPRRTGRAVAIAIAALAMIGGGGFAAMHLRGAATEEPATVVDESEPDVAAEPAPSPAPHTEPVEVPPAIEVAAQGPSAPANSRIDKATTLARKHQCKKAAKLFAKIVDASPQNVTAATAGLGPCRGWLKKHRSDGQSGKLARALGLAKR